MMAERSFHSVKIDQPKVVIAAIGAGGEERTEGFRP